VHTLKVKMSKILRGCKSRLRKQGLKQGEQESRVDLTLYTAISSRLSAPQAVLIQQLKNLHAREKK
jgi:hypothetical protein